MSAFETEEDRLKYPEWQESLRRAMMLELDKGKLKARVADAEAAIFYRQQSLSGDTDHEAERQAIEDALRLLRDFKRTQLGFPDWENK